jgi:hypothetical protein
MAMQSAYTEEQVKEQKDVRLEDERSQVRWYCREDQSYLTHFMVLLDDQGKEEMVIRGQWFSGRSVFSDLAELVGDARAAFIRGLLASEEGGL